MRWTLRSILPIDAISLSIFILLVPASVVGEERDSKNDFSDWCERHGRSNGAYPVIDGICSTAYFWCDAEGRTAVLHCPGGQVFNGKVCDEAPAVCRRPLIRKKGASAQCSENEVHLECGPSCQATCSSDGSSEDVSKDCSNECVPGCFCKFGYLRDSTGRCVRKEECIKDRVPRTGDVFRCPQESGDHASTKLLCDQSYYKCEKWQPKKLYCPDGEIFDADTRKCRPVEELPHCQFDCSDKPERSMHSLGCSQYYWWCWKGRPSKMKCVMDRYFNPANDQCDFRKNVAACEGKQDYTIPPPNPLDPKTATSAPVTSTLASTTLSSQGPINHPVDCSKLKDGNYPHPADPCTDYYYTCSNAVAFRADCAPGLFYNPKMDQCQYKADVPGCSSVVPPEPAALKKALSDRPIEKAEVATYEHHKIVEQYPIDCSDKKDGDYPDPTADCAGHFYTCSNRAATLRSCPPGLYFHAGENACHQWKDVPECIRGDGQMPTTTTTTTTTTTYAPGKIDDQYHEAQPIPASSGGDIDCTTFADGNYADPTNPCSNLFISCSNGHRLIRPCPVDLYYDNGIDQCLRRHEVPACGGVRPNKTSETAPAMCPKPDGVFPYPQNLCNRAYVVCRNGQWDVKQCETGHVFDRENSACADAKQVKGCDTDFCADKKTGDRFPVPVGSQCTSNYIVCVHGTAVVKPCPSSLVFSPLTGRCEYPGDVPACGITRRRIEGHGEVVQDNVNGGQIVQEGGNVIYETGSGDSVVQESQSGGKIVQAGNQENIKVTGACHSLPDGDYAIEPCSRHYRSCGAGVTYPRLCNAGLVFDSTTKRCEHASNLHQCGGLKPVDQAQGQEPTTYPPTYPTTPQLPPQGPAVYHGKDKSNASKVVNFDADYCLNLDDGYYAIAPCSREAIQCTKGRPTVVRCSPGDVFDSLAKLCRPTIYMAPCRDHVPATTTSPYPTHHPNPQHGWWEKHNGEYVQLPPHLQSWYDHRHRLEHGRNDNGEHHSPQQQHSSYQGSPPGTPYYSHQGNKPSIYGQPAAEWTKFWPNRPHHPHQQYVGQSVSLTPPPLVFGQYPPQHRPTLPPRNVHHGYQTPRPTYPSPDRSSSEERDSECEGKAEGWKAAVAPCSGYYVECRRGSLKAMQCADGHTFDHSSKNCALAASVRECNPAAPAEAPRTTTRHPAGVRETVGFCTSKQDGNYPKSECSNEYIQCREEQAYARQCQLPRHVLHPQRRQCEHSANVSTCLGQQTRPVGGAYIEPSNGQPRPGPLSYQFGQRPYGQQHQYRSAPRQGGRPYVIENGDEVGCRRANEIYTKCGAACEPTCNEPRPRCNEGCVAGCHCRPGFVRSIDDSCIPATACARYSDDRSKWDSNEYEYATESSTCSGPNEILKGCASCEPTCSNPRPSCADRPCRRGCACRDGYIRSTDNRCVPLQFCSFYSRKRRFHSSEGDLSSGHSCGDSHGHRCRSVSKSKSTSEEKCPNDNERFDDCKAWCQPTCSDSNIDCSKKKRCVPGCVCLDGYVRSHTGACVKKSKCFEIPAPPKSSKDSKSRKDSRDSSNDSDRTRSSESLDSEEKKYKNFCKGKKTGTYKVGECSSTYVYCKYHAAHVLECKKCEVFNGDRCVPCRSRRKCRRQCSRKRACRFESSESSSGGDGFPHYNGRHFKSASHEYALLHERPEAIAYCSSRPDGYYGVSPCSQEFVHCHHRHSHQRHCQQGYVFEEQLHKCIPANEHYSCGGQSSAGTHPIGDGGYYVPEEQPVGSYPRPLAPGAAKRSSGERRPQSGRNVSDSRLPSSIGGPRYGSVQPLTSGDGLSRTQYFGYGVYQPRHDVHFYNRLRFPTLPLHHRPRGYAPYYYTNYGSRIGQSNFTSGFPSPYYGPPGYAGQVGPSTPSWPNQYLDQIGLAAYYKPGYQTPPASYFYRHHQKPYGQYPQRISEYRPPQYYYGEGRLPQPIPLPPPDTVIDQGVEGAYGFSQQHSRVEGDARGICRGLVDGSFVSLGKCKRQYAECVGGLAIPRVCNEMGHIYDDVTKRCIDRDDEPICRALPPAPTPAKPAGHLAHFCAQKHDGYYSYPSNCTKFVQCHRKDTFIFQCSPGLVFNGKEGVKACDYPRNVPECVDPDLGTGIDLECENLEDGAFLRHPATCEKYRRCVHGRLVDHPCPPGLVFNLRLSVCDYKDNVPECRLRLR